MFPGQSLLDVSGDYLLDRQNHLNDWFEKSIMAFCNTESKNKPPTWSKKATLYRYIYFHVLFYTVEIVGNYYSNLFKHSKELQTISAWHASMIIDSNGQSVQTLPVWLQDVLVNGLSFWRSGLYLRDRRWRQFESLDCIDIDSVHHDFQREIPYVLFYPDLVENVMRAWAKYQSDDGHIVEALAAGCYSPTRKIDRCV